MATRKIIDIEQNGEKVWPKGHAKAIFMSDGSTVEDAINGINNSGNGGEIQKTTEAEITEMGFTKNKGTVTKVKINGSEKSPDANGLVDLGTIEASSNGKKILSSDTTHVTLGVGISIVANTIYVYTVPLTALEIGDVSELEFELNEDYGESLICFTAGEVCPFTCADIVQWANGTPPEIEAGVSYELSIAATKLGNEYIYKAVLTPFKSV